MTGGYDEWAVARTPSLLAFATALVGDAPGADRIANRAVVTALSRTRADWPRASRDDPDLEARRHVVRACGSRRRAAAVLRLVEGRADTEISEVLRCSESEARRLAQRGIAELGPSADIATSPEPGARTRLLAHAGSAPTQLLTRAPDPGRLGPVGSHRTPTRRRRRTWLAVAAVALLVGGVAFIAHESRTADQEISYPRVAVPDSWRYESYAGVELQVPATWGWGGSPIRSSVFAAPRHLGACGTDQAAARAPADHAAYLTSMTPFVGRPAMVSDLCVPWGADGVFPSADAVWFESPLKVGVQQAGSAVAETRAVGGQRVTVFAPDPRLRRLILGTAEQVAVDAYGCPTQVVARPTAGPAGLHPGSMSVCVYSQDSGAATLLYSASVPASAAQEYAARVAAATNSPGGASSSATATPQGQWVALGLHGQRGTRWDVVDVRAGDVELARGRTAALTPDTARAWAHGGVTAYVAAGSGDRALAAYFAAPRS